MNRGRGRETFPGSWHPSVLPPLSWGGGFDREDLSVDSWHSVNRTWQSDLDSFHTLSSGSSHRSLLSLFSDSEGSVEEPEDRLLELLEEAEGNQDSLGTLETSGRVPRDRTVVQPGLEGLETSALRGGRSIRGTREHRESCGPGVGSLEENWRRDEDPVSTQVGLKAVGLAGKETLGPARSVTQTSYTSSPPTSCLSVTIAAPPLTPGQPQTEGFIGNPLHRQHRVPWTRY